MKKAILAVLAVVLVVLGCVVQPPEGLSQEGLITLSLFAFVIVSWIGDLFPKFIATLVAMMLLYFLGVAPSLDVVWRAFISSIFFFLLAAFALAACVKKSSIPTRLMGFFIRVCGSNSKSIVLAFMIVSAVISSMMSDLAACALVSSIVWAIIKEIEMPERFIRSLMIGIPIASLAGGFSTPIGSPSNITIVSLLEQFDIFVGFAQWMTVGLPLALFVVIVSWLAMTIAYKPEKLSDECVCAITSRFDELGKLKPSEIKTIVLIFAMLAAWIAGTWVPMLNSTAVAVAGLCIMFMPGMRLLFWEDFQKEIPWDLVLMLGGLMAMASFLNTTGALDWLVTNVLSGASEWSPIHYMYIVSILICVLRSFVPSGPPVVVMLAPGLIALAFTVGLNPFCVIMAISVWTQITFLIPSIDALYLITYSTGMYTTPQLWRSGIPLTLLFLAILPPITMFLVNMFVPM